MSIALEAMLEGDVGGEGVEDGKVYFVCESRVGDGDDVCCARLCPPPTSGF